MTKGIIIRKPLKKEIICANKGFPIEEKKIEIIILKPIKGQTIK